MSRAAVLNELASDTELNMYGINWDTIFVNYGLDTRPSNSAFLVLRWEESTLFSQTYAGMSNGIQRAPRVLTVWAHMPKEKTTDFDVLDRILRRVEAVLVAMEHVVGIDGVTVTCVRSTGFGRDLEDPGYNTITRNAGFAVLSRLS